MARGEFQRLDRQLDRMRGNLRRVGGESAQLNEHMRRLDSGMGDVQTRMRNLASTGQITRREMQHMQRSFGLLSREALQARRTGALTQDQYRNLRNEIGRTRLDFDALTSNINLNRQVMRNAGNDAERLRQAQARLQQSGERLRLQDERMRQSAARLAAAQATQQERARIAAERLEQQRERLRQSAERLRISEERLRQAQARQAAGATRTAGGGNQTTTLTVQMRDRTAPFFNAIHRRLALLQTRLRGLDGDWARRAGQGLRVLRSGIDPVHRGISRLFAAFVRLGNIINVNKRWTAILLATLLLIGPAAQALGALLVTVLGAAFLALGAFALRGERDVREAFNRMKGTVGASVRAAAQPLRESLVAAMDQVGAAAVKMQPALTSAFRATAPLVDDLVGAFTDFAAAALPGFTAALSSSGPAMSGFRQAMTLLGDGFGEMFRIMTQGSAGEALKQVWIDLGTELRNLLVSLGEFISTASQSGTATTIMVGLFRALTGILNLVAGALEALDPLFDIVAGGIRKITNVGDLKGLPDVFNASGKSLKSLQKDLAATDKEITRIKEAQKAASDIPGPARDLHLKDLKASEEDLAAAQARRKDILAAIADAERAAAEETLKHAQGVKGLTEAIQGLANVNRTYLDAQSAQNEALNKAKEDMGKYSNALKFTNGSLDTTSTVAQEAYKLLSDLGRATSETTAKAIEANAPWETVRGNWQKSYGDLVRLADGMGLSKTQAQELATQILGMPPSKDMWINARVAQAKTDIQSVIAAFDAAPDKQTVVVEALTADAIKHLEAVGFKTERLPDGKTKVTTLTGDATTAIETLRALLNGINGKTVSTYTNHYITSKYTSLYMVKQIGPGDKGYGVYAPAMGGLVARAPRKATGGRVQAVPNGGLMEGPGGPTSDSIMAMLPSGPIRVSDSEFVVRASSVAKYGTGMLNAINSGRFPRLSGFKRGGLTKAQKAAQARAKSERDARNAAVGDLTVSRFGWWAGSRNSEFTTELRKPDSRQGLVDSLNQARTLIKKTTHGGTESSLLRRLDSAGKALLKYESKLSKVNKSLESAKKKLDDLKQAASQLKESVKQGVLRDANITQSATAGDSRATINTILSQMTASAANSNQFAAMLSELKKRGLDKGLISEIAEAGVSGGGMETAAAILGGGKGDISRLNQLRASIAKAGDHAGKTAADAMYGAGIKAADGLVAGLTKQKKSIENAMLNIARSMEKAIKKALKIKSPSKVMEEVGHFTAEGFAVGMERNSRPRQTWDSMLNVHPSGGRSPAAAPGGQPIVVQLRVGDKDLGEIIIDPLRRAVHHRGGNVQAVLGK